MFKHLSILLAFSLIGCKMVDEEAGPPIELPKERKGVYLTVLGNVQDGGAPHIDCQKVCCYDLMSHPDPNRMVVALGLVDFTVDKKFLFEASPDITRQLSILQKFSGDTISSIPDGIFITHAHIGHYTGLMYLGKEAKGANQVPVYAMPKMGMFLSENGPWNQLITDSNIVLNGLIADSAQQLTKDIQVTPIPVPHRDEFSETVGYVIAGPKRKALFIPDIDKWSKWSKNLIEILSEVDFAFLDATFYNGSEINSRDISEIPHPFVIETIDLLKSLPETEKSKVHFIHFNHTNQLLRKGTPARQYVKNMGFNLAQFGMSFEL